MSDHISGLGRTAAALVAIVVWAALALQANLTIGKITGEGGTVIDAIWLLVGFFTILTNLIVALTMTAVALGIWPGGSNPSDATLAAVTLYIVIVGVIFHVLLSKLQDLEGLWEIADHLLHYASPVLTVVFWLLFAPKGRLSFGHAFVWLVYPLAYCLYALVRGHLTGWYPYPFINVAELGLERVLINVAGLTAAVLAASLALIFAVRLFCRPRH